ncbi:hypothetical protein HanIR_Chr15g0772251 [Helianthus annuus]|nr:hypothetical protein HanIR_Chr15g0772251 [Helianthus annuus]
MGFSTVCGRKIPRGADEKIQGVRTKKSKGCKRDFQRKIALKFFFPGGAPGHLGLHHWDPRINSLTTFDKVDGENDLTNDLGCGH